ncbi:MAG: hypothetical protein ACI80V_002406 [Rhodothermales bacterium]|jgi:hypothetical protein
MTRLISIWIVLIFVAVGAQGQAFTATWPLLNPPQQAGIGTGAVTVSDELVNAGNAPGLAIVGYNSFGQQVNQGSNAWVEGVDHTRYIEFTVSATPGNVMTLNQIDFEYGWEFSFGILIASEVWISPDLWGTSQQLATTLLYQKQTMAQYTSSAPGTTSSTWTVRIYPYSNQNTGAVLPIYATHRNVVLSGSTSPTTNLTCDFLCNADFEDDQLVSALGQGFFDEALVSCWKTTATNHKIEVWGDGFGGIFAPSGNQFIELNANQTATLYQSFTAVASTPVTISFWHSGRYTAPDVMEVSLTGLGGTPVYATFGPYSDTRAAWTPYTIPYTLPISGPMELRFNSISSNGGAGPADGGNFLDDIAISCPSGICGLKFNDVNGNGVQDSGETGLANWEFTLSGASTGEATSDANGRFCFADLAPGTYFLGETNQAGWIQTAPPAPGTFDIDLGSGENLNGYAFGNQREVADMCYGPPLGMVGWWPGDGHTNDLSGHQNTGVLQGGAGYVTPGEVSDAFSFSGPADYVRVNDSASLNFGAGANFSIDAWVKTSDATNILNIVDKRAGFVAGYGLYLIGGKLAFQIGDGASPLNFVSASPNVSNGAWHFVAVTVERASKTGGILYVDNIPVLVFDPTSRQGSLANNSPLLIGQNSLSAGAGFRGQIDEVEIFDRVVTPIELGAIYEAGPLGKCKGLCDEKPQSLSMTTGFDHPAGTTYAVGGADAFWTITADPDTTRTVPRPADVIMSIPAWTPAPSGSQWIGPSQVTPDPAPPNFEQDAVGLGTYTYSLEFCIVDQTATSLTFNLGVLSDNSATVWLLEPDGTRTQIGIANSFTIPASIINTLNGPFVPGTYKLEVDVLNNALPPDFTGFNLTGSISGGNLFMQKHECCNSSGKITGRKFNDLNGDGLSVGDPGLGGVTIELWQDGVLFATTTTDAWGYYFFDVPPGTYTILEVAPTGYQQTAPAGGTYTITVGPGGIVPNRDFGNQAIPCIATDVQFLCKPNGGGRYIQLEITYNGTIPAVEMHVTSLTPGVSFVVTSTIPATLPNPITQGAVFTLNIDFAGLAPGASAVMLINMDGPTDEFGVTTHCCDKEVTVTRPAIQAGGALFECPLIIDGWVDIDDVSVPKNGWLVRMERADGVMSLVETDPAGYFAQEGLLPDMYSVSVDMRNFFRVAEPEGGFFSVSLKEGGPRTTLRFMLSKGTHTDSEDDSDTLPTEYGLRANYPNPFNPTTRIEYQLPDAGAVRIVVVDMLGRSVATLVDGLQPAGSYAVTFDAGDLPSGLYLYRMTAGSFVKTNRMILLK